MNVSDAVRVPEAEWDATPESDRELYREAARRNGYVYGVRIETTAPVNARYWCRSIILGSGGLHDFEAHEGPRLSPDGRDVEVAMWTLRCLRNPDCRGSREILAALNDAAGKQ